MSMSADGGRYFAGPAEGYEGAPMIEVYAGQIMASICGGLCSGHDLRLPNSFDILADRAPIIARVSVLLARALLIELGYPSLIEEKAEKARLAAAARRDIQECEGLDQAKEGMDPTLVDF
jgi:hypothetical protein